ncbi:DNA mismatch repair protein Msh2 [Folsomia candida]|uniref:DNA mismatch repair protein Msh2 n=1 Tax=Folsomia candida TaxID=158441 RepID=A0A226EK97_FOLCA|nr:DNA mismatch repair protein Msh2 [Folsomia candida]
MSKNDGKDLVEDGLYIAAFKRVSEQSAGTVRFFDTDGDGEKFVVYNNDARLASKELIGNISIRTCKYKIGNEEKVLDYAYIRRSNFETFVRDLLLVRQYRVEVFINESTTKGRIDWVPKYKASPGNLAQFDDILFNNSGTEMTVNNGVMGIRIGNVDKTKTVGVAHVNLNECEIHLLEFADNDSLTNLESVLILLSPKEAVFPVVASQAGDVNTLRKIIERNRILINEKKIGDFDDKDIDQDMKRLLQFTKGKLRNISTLPEFDKKLAVSALAGTIKYLELLSGESYQNQFRVVPFDFGLYVKMDLAACRALHLSLNNLEKNSRNNVNLQSTIDQCRTAQGHRLMAQYLRQPLVSKEKLEERYDLVQILMDDIILRQTLRDDHLRKVPDCQTFARKLYRKKCTLQDYYKSYLFLTTMDKMLEDLKTHEGEKQHVLQSWFIDPLTTLDEELSKFKELIQTTLDLEMAGKGEYVVQADFDESLLEFKNEMDSIQTEMGDLLYKVAKELGLEANKSVKLESNSQNGYFFRVTLKEEKSIRGNNKFTMIRSTKGAVGFTNSKLIQLSDSYIGYRSQYESEQRGIVADMAGVAADYYTCFEQLGRILAELDVFTSFAFCSVNSTLPYVRPKLLPKGTGRIHFEGLRHPCIESFADVNFIPNDVDFEKDKQNFYILTGPNMGGKSTFLRSVGIATLLAHVGCFVPATAAEVSIVDAILARVGASDSLDKGISTFMAEMIEASYILKTATPDSLVIIDELGRGTSTYDGFGLCWAITKYLAKNVGCYGILATHFHELTDLADEILTVANYHVAAIATDGGLTMLYKIQKGKNLIYVGFPKDVLDEAKQMSKVLEDYCQEEDTDDSEAAVKRRRDNKNAGQKVVDEFMDEIRQYCKEQVPANGTITEEAEAAFQSKFQELLREVKVKAAANPYLQHLLRQASAEADKNRVSKTCELMDTDDNEEMDIGGHTDEENWYN